MAKQGPEKSWHFAHATSVADRSCAESALHQAAKTLLSEIGALTLPALSTTLSGQDALDREEAYLYVNAVRTLMAYIDTKVADAAASKVLDDAQNARA